MTRARRSGDIRASSGHRVYHYLSRWPFRAGKPPLGVSGQRLGFAPGFGIGKPMMRQGKSSLPTIGRVGVLTCRQIDSSEITRLASPLTSDQQQHWSTCQCGPVDVQRPVSRANLAL